jgi:hypothetical protein
VVPIPSSTSQSVGDRIRSRSHDDVAVLHARPAAFPCAHVHGADATDERHCHPLEMAARFPRHRNRSRSVYNTRRLCPKSFWFGEHRDRALHGGYDARRGCECSCESHWAVTASAGLCRRARATRTSWSSVTDAPRYTEVRARRADAERPTRNAGDGAALTTVVAGDPLSPAYVERDAAAQPPVIRDQIAAKKVAQISPNGEPLGPSSLHSASEVEYELAGRGVDVR